MLEWLILPFLPILILWAFLRKAKRERPVVGFFHPYCNAGGGGERVLWTAIKALHKEFPSCDTVVYTGDTEASGEEILKKAEGRFGIRLEKPVRFVFLRWRRWVEAERYPLFTMLGQTIGGLLLGAEALLKLQPDIFLDTMGYPFTLPLFRLAGSKVGCYVHYPVISTDMLEMVRSRREAYNNRFSGPFLSRLKLIYYRLFAGFYSLMGRFSQLNMVNSSWTYGHISALWGDDGGRTHIVFPPCDTAAFLKLRMKSEDLDEIRILSVGQFRPEKNHPLQLRAFKRFTLLYEAAVPEQRKALKLVLAGSCRHSEDLERVERLRELANELEIESSVEWKLNIPYEDLLEELSSALIGLHTMWNEHFGIGIVEGMASGNVMIAHNSGGPKLDILVGGKVGLLAASETEYAEAMLKVALMSREERDAIRASAKQRADTFSELAFDSAFLRLFRTLL